jgi:hypothetical protein
MFTQTRLATGVATILAGLTLIAGAAQAAPPKVKTSDPSTTYASITHTAGGIEFAAGNYADKVFKSGAITYALKLLPNKDGTITVKVPTVVLYTGTGSLSGTATATVTIANSKETITNGKLNLTKGTGALKGDSFKGTFTGTGDLTANTLVFHTKGILTH